jgi:hypothetical protein
VIASSRPRTDRVIEIPVRMRQTRTATKTEEPQSGLFCQAETTRIMAAERCGPTGATHDQRCKSIGTGAGTAAYTDCRCLRGQADGPAPRRQDWCAPVRVLRTQRQQPWPLHL